LDARLLEVGAVDALEPGDFLVLVGDQGRPVERGRRHCPAETRGIREFVGKARCIDQELLGYAAADDAGAADAILLDGQHSDTVAGSDPRRPHAAGAGPDDEQVDVVRRRRSCHNGWPFFCISLRIRAITVSANASAHCWARFKPSSIALGSSLLNFWPSGVL